MDPEHLVQWGFMIEKDHINKIVELHEIIKNYDNQTKQIGKTNKNGSQRILQTLHLAKYIIRNGNE